MPKKISPKYKWYILALGTATHIFVFAMPRMCMPVLFPEISADLNLSLVQLGTIWGTIGLPALFSSFAYGLLGDRYGVGLTLGLACLLQGITGALRGMAGDFTSLAVYTFLFGLFSIPLSLFTHKAAGEWFSGKQLGLANGILAAGIATGMTLSSMISATVLSPLLGGWQNIMFVFGAIAILFSFLWFRTKSSPSHDEAKRSAGKVAFRQALAHVLRLKSVWLLAIAQMFFIGCGLGVIGYLPLYLRSCGWTEVAADGALTALNAASIAGSIPLALLSDRVGIRKAVVYPMIAASIVGAGLLSVLGGGMVWPLVILIGLVQTGFAAIAMTMIMEIKGVGAIYAGTALGLYATTGGIGQFLPPIIGNSLAEINPSFAFIFWAALAVAALIVFYFVEETGWAKDRKLAQPS